MNRTRLAVGLILFVVVIPHISSTAQDVESLSAASNGAWWYVGGTGPGNYSNIQDAINHSQDGDTVFVYSGMYHERLIIRTAICLIGESTNTTIIDAINSDEGALISLESNTISISGFTLRFNGDWGHPRIIISNLNPHQEIANITISHNIFQANISTCIWLLGCDFCTITQNIFYLHQSDGIQNGNGDKWVIANNHMIGSREINNGIFLERVHNCTITNNSIISTLQGVGVDSSQQNNISYNYFFNNSHAISIYEWAEENSIYSNYIDNPIHLKLFIDDITGISVRSGSNYNIIQKNSIRHCKLGILLENVYGTVVTMNTFMNNIVHARFYNTLMPNHWNQNYWGRPRILPKPIVGIRDIGHIYPWCVEFDWHPAQVPYEIEG